MWAAKVSINGYTASGKSDFGDRQKRLKWDNW